MKSYVTVGAVTHTHTHTHGNLINNEKINIYAIFMYFSRKKMHINIAYFLYHKIKKKITIKNIRRKER